MVLLQKEPSNSTVLQHFKYGGPERNRTSDLRFRKPSLYPLSYGATMVIIITQRVVQQ